MSRAAFECYPEGRPPEATARTARRELARLATLITDDCINCGACEPQCPNDAIYRGDDIYVIEPALCTECVGFNDREACQSVCPVACCLPDPKRVESEAVLLDRALRLHPNDRELRERAVAGTFPSRFKK
jgi:ferredoxin